MKKDKCVFGPQQCYIFIFYLKNFHVNLYFITEHGVYGSDTIFIMWQKREPTHRETG